MRQWRARDPVTRFQRWLVEQGWWDEGRDTEARQAARRWVLLPLLLVLRVLGLLVGRLGCHLDVLLLAASLPACQPACLLALVLLPVP
jgi:hypothetical protein